MSTDLLFWKVLANERDFLRNFAIKTIKEPLFYGR